MHYNIRHVTRFTYETPISESVMEARMQPRTDPAQRCLHFGLSTQPASRVMMHQDHQGNVVHHFNIPGRHSQLTVTAEALVEVGAPAELPCSLERGAWERLDALTGSGEFWDVLNPSPFARRTALLGALSREIGLARGDDPLVTVRQLTSEIYTRFEYSPHSTRVDSPIDDALDARSGVCQDFAHVMIALVRGLGLPCRYVSGYLFQQGDDWSQFFSNVGTMPLNSSSTFIRSSHMTYENRSGRPTRVLAGGDFLSLLGPMQDLVTAFDSGRVQTYDQVIQMSK